MPKHARFLTYTWYIRIGRNREPGHVEVAYSINGVPIRLTEFKDESWATL